MTPAEPAPPAEPTFSALSEPIPPEMRAQMIGVSWRADCPVTLDDLRLVTLTHWNFEGEVVQGQLIVAEDAVSAVRQAFAAAFAERFPIERMEPVHRYGGDDDRSMAANNTSGFNCRPVGGSSRWSEHAFGHAIDVNPVQNPYVRGERVQPEAGTAFLDRSERRAGMLFEDSALVRSFREQGWGWGGAWRSVKDYQHVSKGGT